MGRDLQYDVFADEFAEHAEHGFYNAYYDRPACLALLGDVAGQRVSTRRAAPAGTPPNSSAVVVLSRQHPTGDWQHHDGREPKGFMAFRLRPRP